MTKKINGLETANEDEEEDIERSKNDDEEDANNEAPESLAPPEKRNSDFVFDIDCWPLHEPKYKNP